MTVAAPARWFTGVALASLALAGCSSVSRGSLEAVRLAVHRDTVHPTAQSVAATPYYQLQVEGPDGGAVLILASTDDGRLGWYGNGSDLVFTRDGLVVATAGLPQNLDGTTIEGADPFREGLQHLRGPTESTRRVDWSPGYRYGVLGRSRLVPGAMEDVTILDTVHRLRRIDETLSFAEPGITVHNRYWIDPTDGFVWKSRQYIAPGLALELTQLRPYRGDAR